LNSHNFGLITKFPRPAFCRRVAVSMTDPMNRIRLSRGGRIAKHLAMPTADRSEWEHP
jgi:hypothetical protein